MLAFLEKTEDPPTDQINAGTYVFNRDHRPHPAGPGGVGRTRSIPGLLAEGARVCAYVDSTYWRDMGTPDDFVRGSADLVRGWRLRRHWAVGAVRAWCTTGLPWLRARC